MTLNCKTRVCIRFETWCALSESLCTAWAWRASDTSGNTKMLAIFHAEGPMCSFLLSSSIHVIIWDLLRSTPPLVPAFNLRSMRWRAASDICGDRPCLRSADPLRSTQSWALKAAEERELQLRVRYLRCIKMRAKKPVVDLAGAVKIRMYLKIVARFLPLAAARAGTDTPCALRWRISLKDLASESDDCGAWLAFGFFLARARSPSPFLVKVHTFEPVNTFEPA